METIYAVNLFVSIASIVVYDKNAVLHVHAAVNLDNLT